MAYTLVLQLAEGQYPEQIRPVRYATYDLTDGDLASPFTVLAERVLTPLAATVLRDVHKPADK